MSPELLFAILAVGMTDIMSGLFGIYVFFVNLIFVVFILARRFFSQDGMVYFVIPVEYEKSNRDRYRS